jgi:hypothetical protein
MRYLCNIFVDLIDLNEIVSERLVLKSLNIDKSVLKVVTIIIINRMAVKPFYNKWNLEAHGKNHLSIYK